MKKIIYFAAIFLFLFLSAFGYSRSTTTTTEEELKFKNFYTIYSTNYDYYPDLFVATPIFSNFQDYEDFYNNYLMRPDYFNNTTYMQLKDKYDEEYFKHNTIILIEFKMYYINNYIIKNVELDGTTLKLYYDPAGQTKLSYRTVNFIIEVNKSIKIENIELIKVI